MEKSWGAYLKFHNVGLCHADLNAYNILIDEDTNMWLIDFDKSKILSPGGGWRHDNLKRLKRSLKKYVMKKAVQISNHLIGLSYLMVIPMHQGLCNNPRNFLVNFYISDESNNTVLGIIEFVLQEF